MPKETVTFDDLVTDGVQKILLSFGKGENLRSAVWAIVNGTCCWCEQREQEKKDV